jgi:hypothetical protein
MLAVETKSRMFSTHFITQRDTYMIRPARASYGDEDCMGPIVLVSFDRETGRQTPAAWDDAVDGVMGDNSAVAQQELQWRWETGKAALCKNRCC